MRLRRLFMLPVLPAAVLGLVLLQGQAPSSQTAWSAYLPGLGTFSSPRTADLNNDGTLDIILGAGREEFISTDSAVIALDGVTGRILWHVAARDQVFGSAALKDITQDGVADVFIGGRSAELMALDGASGAVLWDYYPAGDTVPARDANLYNFYNPQFIPDQDGDGIEDIVTTNGGDVMAAPYHPDRPPGTLMLLSGKDGRLLARAEMPDGQETYMSPLVHAFRETESVSILMGSGGETLGGHLFRTTLEALLQGDISSATVLAESETKGFIAPPVLADITADGVNDIIANAVDGRMLAFDGSTNAPLWSIRIPNTEAYSSIAVGYFTQDSIPDFFASFASGQWPNLGWSRQFMVDGGTGTIVFEDSLGLYQTSSPVVVDANSDGLDEVILSVNYQVVDEYEQRFYYTMLVLIDFANDTVTKLSDSFNGANVSSTPWIGDLDNDQRLDIIYCHTTDTTRTYTFNGLQVNRIVTDIPIRTALPWNTYMGNGLDGVFRPNEPGRTVQPRIPQH